MKKWFKLPTTLIAALLPITLLLAISMIASLPGYPGGDTTLAWAPFFLTIRVIPAIIALLVTGIFKNNTAQFVVGIGAPTYVYIWTYSYLGGADGIPHTLSGTLIWFIALLLCLSPLAKPLFKGKNKNNSR